MSSMPRAQYEALQGGKLMKTMSEYCPWEQPTGRILFVDAYDSFSNNIVALLKEILCVDVDVVKMDLPHVPGRRLDERWERWYESGILGFYDAVVCGPGPGSPDNPDDVGIFNYFYELASPVPVLGICLGFQSLVLHSNGKIRRLKRGLHGMVRNIEFDPRHTLKKRHVLYKVSPFRATLYHSLCADIGQDDVLEEHWDEDKWRVSPRCLKLSPLAWASEPRDDGTTERILMMVEHMEKPFLGLQYHPESVCTDPAGHRILRNWFGMVRDWNFANKRRIKKSVPGSTPQFSHVETLLARQENDARSYASTSMPSSDGQDNDWSNFLLDYKYTCEKIALPDGFGAPEVVEALQLDLSEAIILDSSSSQTGDPRATHSIIAVGLNDALRIDYRMSDNTLTIFLPSWFDENGRQLAVLEEGASVWEGISNFWMARAARLQSAQQQREIKAGPESFKGGFMGYVTYEMGLAGIAADVPLKNRGHYRPDLCFAWVTKSVVLDHRAGIAYVQNLASETRDDFAWAETTAKLIQASPCWQKGQRVVPRIREKPRPRAVKITPPNATRYEKKVQLCKEKIAKGESYELCLTAPTHMSRPIQSDDPDGTTPWEIYQTLRERQPAPFGSFIRLGGATLLSSSPERFLNHDSDGLCTMRPMKGTVKKSEAVSTLKQAEKILHIPKEEAENLMIVDLVRHDLHKVCGPGKVAVRDLLKVEEYASVFQMITVVKGQLPFMKYYTGLDALSAALPPGSMTGAPKKRSCELLHAIEEGEERSLYSGVVGYMDITGKGDWSVTIRSIFRWEDEFDVPPGEGTGGREMWHIGAGGAVTILSTPEGETDEMFVKLTGPLAVFRDAA